MVDVSKGDGGSLKKSAIVTVTYNKVPRFDIFQKAVAYVDYVIICDNSSDPQVISRLQKYCALHQKFILLQNNGNLGISKAYNKAVAYAQSLGVFWLYFFDDDANFELSWLQEAPNAWKTLEAQNIPVGLLAPIITNNQRYLHSDLGFKTPFSIISSAITSGLFTNTLVFNRCGGYNPEYFVDWADLELCRRMQQSGRLVVRLNKVLVYQTFGRNLENNRIQNRLVNGYIKSIAMLSLRMNKSNTLSTVYSVYSPGRYRDQQKFALWSMKRSGIKNLGFRLVLIFIHHLVLPKILKKEVLYPSRG